MQNTAFHKVALPDAWHPIPTEKSSSDILSVITGRKLIVLCCTLIGLDAGNRLSRGDASCSTRPTQKC